MSPDELRQAFEARVAPHYGRIYGLAYTLCKQRQAAEDVTQETLVAAFKNCERWRETTPEELEKWLLRIANNKAVDWLRREGRRGLGRTVSFEEGCRDSAVEPGDDPRAEEKADLPDCVETALDDFQRSVVELKYRDEDLTFGALGSLLGRPAHTVRYHHGTALAALRACLERKRARRMAILQEGAKK